MIRFDHTILPVLQRQSNNSLKLLISKELAGQEKEETDLTPISSGSKQMEFELE